jgi:hypothetical protein
MRYHYDAALPPGFTLDAFQTAVETRGGRFAHQLPRGPLQLAESIWRWEDEPSGIRYIYDHFVDVAFARVESETYGRPANLMYELEAVLPFQYTEQLREQAASDDAATRAHAIRALAVTTPSFRIDVFDVIREALFDADPRLRGTAMKAIARWPYVRFAAELDQRAQTETVPELQREAVRLAADLRQHGRRGLH